MKHVILYVLFSFTVAVSMAQQVPTSGQAFNEKWFVRWSPLGLADFLDGNLSVGAEYRFNKTFSATMDAAYIFYSAYAQRSKSTAGVIWRPALRTYINDYFFLDFQFHYKNVTYTIRDSIAHAATPTTVAYRADSSFKFKRVVTGFNIMAGCKVPLANDHRFFIEFYAGLGIHYKYQQYNRNPHSIYEQPPHIHFVKLNDYNGQAFVAIPMGLRIVYRLQ